MSAQHHVYEMYPAEFTKQHNVEFFPSYPADPVSAPLIEQFENDIDDSFDLFPDFPVQILDTTAPFLHPNQQPGPLSAITVSSESFDSRSSYSDAFTNEHNSFIYNANPEQTFDFNFDMMSLSSAQIGSDYGVVQSINETPETTSFGALPPSPPPAYSPSVPMYGAEVNYQQKAYSDYAPQRRSSTASSDYYSHSSYTPSSHSHSDISHVHMDTQRPMVALVAPQPVAVEVKVKSAKKYQCPKCILAFARAYNLKTHMDIHNPNRRKPFPCPQPECKGAFSRKHDLSRHITSCHREDACGLKAQIGVQRAPRSRCDNCGKSCVGRDVKCDCAEVR